MYPFCLCLYLTLLGAPLGLHHPHAARATPSGMYLPAFIQVDLLFMLNLLTAITCSITARHGSVHPMQFAYTLRGGVLSIATQELLLALQPSPPGLDHGIATWHTSGG